MQKAPTVRNIDISGTTPTYAERQLLTTSSPETSFIERLLRYKQGGCINHDNFQAGVITRHHLLSRTPQPVPCVRPKRPSPLWREHVPVH